MPKKIKMVRPDAIKLHNQMVMIQREKCGECWFYQRNKCSEIGFLENGDRKPGCQGGLNMKKELDRTVIC